MATSKASLGQEGKGVTSIRKGEVYCLNLQRNLSCLGVDSKLASLDSFILPGRVDVSVWKRKSEKMKALVDISQSTKARVSAEVAMATCCTFQSVVCAVDDTHLWPYRIILEGGLDCELAFKTVKEMNQWSKALILSTPQAEQRRKGLVFHVNKHLRKSSPAVSPRPRQSLTHGTASKECPYYIEPECDSIDDEAQQVVITTNKRSIQCAAMTTDQSHASGKLKGTQTVGNSASSFEQMCTVPGFQDDVFDDKERTTESRNLFLDEKTGRGLDEQAEYLTLVDGIHDVNQEAYIILLGPENSSEDTCVRSELPPLPVGDLAEKEKTIIENDSSCTSPPVPYVTVTMASLPRPSTPTAYRSRSSSPTAQRSRPSSPRMTPRSRPTSPVTCRSGPNPPSPQRLRSSSPSTQQPRSTSPRVYISRSTSPSAQCPMPGPACRPRSRPGSPTTQRSRPTSPRDKRLIQRSRPSSPNSQRLRCTSPSTAHRSSSPRHRQPRPSSPIPERQQRSSSRCLVPRPDLPLLPATSPTGSIHSLTSVSSNRSHLRSPLSPFPDREEQFSRLLQLHQEVNHRESHEVYETFLPGSQKSTGKGRKSS